MLLFALKKSIPKRFQLFFYHNNLSISIISSFNIKKAITTDTTTYCYSLFKEKNTASFKASSEFTDTIKKVDNFKLKIKNFEKEIDSIKKEVEKAAPAKKTPSKPKTKTATKTAPKKPSTAKTKSTVKQ